MTVEMFGPYRLDELVGGGGVGEVFRAYDTANRREVAVKRLPRWLAHDTGFLTRFRRESAVAARLREAHVIPIHDFGEIDGRLFIDMRLVDGLDLATVLDRDGPLPPARAVHVVEQVAGALDAAHAEGLVHRDVRPSNVLLADGVAYLIGFGVARAALVASPDGAAAATVAHLAPERFTGSTGDDPRTDVYALACLLYETLTGRRPFETTDAVAMMYAHLGAQPPRPSRVAPSLAAFDEVVATGMAKDPGRRYAGAGALAEAARVALAGPGARATVELRLPVPDPFPPPAGPASARVRPDTTPQQ